MATLNAGYDAASAHPAFAVDPSYRVDDFVNVFKLQSVMNNLVSRLDAQQAHIERLEAELRSKSVTADQFDATARALSSRLEHVESSVTKWAAAWDRMDATAASLDKHMSRLAACETSISAKADLAEVTCLKNDITEAFALHRDELARTHAPADGLAAVEESQHRVVEEIVAIQKLLACKVDRVELPLLATANEKLNRISAFNDAAAPRLAQLEEAVVATTRVLAQKEDKDSARERADGLAAELRQRPPLRWMLERVITPMDALQRDVDAVGQSRAAMEAALGRVDALAARAAAADAAAAAASSALTALERRLAAAVAAAEAKPSAEDVGSRLGAHDAAIERALRQHADRASAEAKVQAAYVAELKGEIEALARKHEAAEKKLGVALRFVEWFADVKLKGVAAGGVDG